MGAPYPVFLAVAARSSRLFQACQGLTLGPLMRALDLRDDDPVRQEVGAARDRALRAGLAELEHDDRRSERMSGRKSLRTGGPPMPTRNKGKRDDSPTVLAMRASEEIGDDAFHQMEEERIGSKCQPAAEKIGRPER